jgi:DNA repair protein RecN (Recombination protein N)
MLERLTIRDLALIERAELAFGDGLNALTGETGAGKTLVVHAVDLLVGGRADADTVREGARAAVIEGVFQVEGERAARVAELLGSWGVPNEDDALIVRREVQAGGRSRGTVNQASVTVASLKRLGEMLLDLHGQREHQGHGPYEHQSLLRPGAGLVTLDRLARLEPEVAGYGESLAALREAQGELERLEASLATYADHREWMEQAARDLDQAKLRDGEEEELGREAARLAHADRLRELTALALDRLAESEGSAASSIAAAAHALEQAAALDASLSEHLPALDEARIAAAEAARALQAYAADLDADPQALEQVEARRDTIARLTRRYRRGVAELIAWREELAAEIATGEDAPGSLERARQRVTDAEKTCREQATKLTRARRAAAKEWSTKLTRELKPLGFAHARLDFELNANAGTPPLGPRGVDEVEIQFTGNEGEQARPLHRVASGGELSRIMLALKTALEAQDPVDVLLFDEVDSGIGGAVAQAVGERLRRLSRHRQIICVTHLPMIAALASHHVRVAKRVAGGRTVAELDVVEGAVRIDELARMMAGDRVTETTRRQAREMLGATG